MLREKEIEYTIGIDEFLNSQDFHNNIETMRKERDTVVNKLERARNDISDIQNLKSKIIQNAIQESEISEMDEYSMKISVLKEEIENEIEKNEK